MQIQFDCRWGMFLDKAIEQQQAKLALLSDVPANHARPVKTRLITPAPRRKGSNMGDLAGNSIKVTGHEPAAVVERVMAYLADRAVRWRLYESVPRCAGAAPMRLMRGAGTDADHARRRGGLDGMGRARTRAF